MGEEGTQAVTAKGAPVVLTLLPHLPDLHLQRSQQNMAETVIQRTRCADF